MSGSSSTYVRPPVVGSTNSNFSILGSYLETECNDIDPNINFEETTVNGVPVILVTNVSESDILALPVPTVISLDNDAIDLLSVGVSTSATGIKAINVYGLKDIMTQRLKISNAQAQSQVLTRYTPFAASFNGKTLNQVVDTLTSFGVQASTVGQHKKYSLAFTTKSTALAIKNATQGAVQPDPTIDWKQPCRTGFPWGA